MSLRCRISRCFTTLCFHRSPKPEPSGLESRAVFLCFSWTERELDYQKSKIKQTVLSQLIREMIECESEEKEADAGESPGCSPTWLSAIVWLTAGREFGGLWGEVCPGPVNDWQQPGALQGRLHETREDGGRIWVMNIYLYGGAFSIAQLLHYLDRFSTESVCLQERRRRHRDRRRNTLQWMNQTKLP